MLRHPRATALVFAAALSLPPAFGAAAELAVPMSPAELAEARGGVQLPNGLELGFGAVMSTYLDGELALQTRLTWTPEGPQTSLDAGAYTPDLAQAAAAAGISISPDQHGLLAPGAGGATVILHDLAEGRLGNVALNTANGRALRQETEITLSVPQLDAYQSNLAFQRQFQQLQTNLGLAQRSAIN